MSKGLKEFMTIEKEDPKKIVLFCQILIVFLQN